MSYTQFLVSMLSLCAAASLLATDAHAEATKWDYNPNSEYIPISYLAIAVCFTTILPAAWHGRVRREYKDALKQKGEICT